MVEELKKCPFCDKNPEILSENDGEPLYIIIVAHISLLNVVVGLGGSHILLVSLIPQRSGNKWKNWQLKLGMQGGNDG